MSESNDKYRILEDKNFKAELGGGQERIDRQHAAGRKTARERILNLVDTGTFVEMDKFVIHRSHDFNMEKNQIPGDGVVSGYGRIDGGLCMFLPRIYSLWRHNESLNADKIIKIMDPRHENGERRS